MAKKNSFKEVDKMKYLVVFLLTVIIFFSGLLLGNYLTGKKLEKISSIEQNIRLDTLGAEVQYQILIGDPCRFVNSTPLTQELYDLSEKLDYLENIYGEKDPNVVQLKEQYFLLEVRHWLYVRKTNQECNTTSIPILYFYSNSGNCPQCQEQGYILTYLRKKYPNIRVYSFDINIDNSAVDTIKKIYDVSSAPTIIMGSTVYPQFMSRNALESALQARMK